MKNENLLDAQTVVKLCGFSRHIFELMRANGQVPQPVMLGNRRFWHKPTIHAWIKSGFKTIEQQELNKEVK